MATLKSTNINGSLSVNGDVVINGNVLDTNYIISGSQTTTSDLDGGSNIYTFTTNSGSTSTFTVKNGSKGSNGTAAGFGTPTASVDANIGTPSVTITASGADTAKVFNFAFKNLKGSTGATGVGISSISTGTPTTASDYTTTPITISKSDGTSTTVNVKAKNGSDATVDTSKFATLSGDNIFTGTNQFTVPNSFGSTTSSEALTLLPSVRSPGQEYLKLGFISNYPAIKARDTATMKDRVFKFPSDKAAGTYTFATTDDIDTKFDKTGGTITGDVSIIGNLTVGGTTNASDTYATKSYVDSTVKIKSASLSGTVLTLTI